MALLEAAILLSASALAQSGPSIINVACHPAFADTRAPLSTLLPSGPTFANCIEVANWGDAARAPSPSPGAPPPAVVLEAFRLSLPAEVPETRLFRRSLLTGTALSGPLRLFEVRVVAAPDLPIGALSGLELEQPLVQSVATSVTEAGMPTAILLQATAATWRAWTPASPGPSATPALEYRKSFTSP